MLYTPPAFKIDDLAILHDHIEQTGLAILATSSTTGPLASHVPLFLDRHIGAQGTLFGHLARANLQTTQSMLDHSVLAIFQGPEAYVSPGWYASKREHGRVVPTWNYAVVHVRGRLSFFDDREKLHAVVDRLTSLHEAKFSDPWATTDAPKAFMESQLKGIVGFELKIDTIEGKYKLSQNRSSQDQNGVVDGLRQVGSVTDIGMADLMARQPTGRSS
jgi:transcriptional regulator